MTGLFVTLEGIDRSGKTSQARMLVEALGHGAVAVREPGGTAAGERIRALLKDPDASIEPRTEALLFAAARAQLVAEVIRPALASGRVVVCDRYVDSSLAYQGAARGLGVEEVARLNEWATSGLMPDLTILLWLDPKVALARAGDRDRFEDEGADLQRAVAAAYDRLATADARRWRRVDASRPVDDVHADVVKLVEAARAGAGAAA